MKKWRKAILVTFGALIILSKTFSQDTIYWHPDYNLSWGDFQGVPDSSSKFGAVSNPIIKYFLSANEDSMCISVRCFFIKKKSWSKYKNDDTLLIHERGHFDIAEIFARRLRQSFKNYKFNYQTVSADIEKIFKLNKQERISMDILYDKETNLSRNRKQQVLWNKKIAQELRRLEQFK